MKRQRLGLYNVKASKFWGPRKILSVVDNVLKNWSHKEHIAFDLLKLAPVSQRMWTESGDNKYVNKGPSQLQLQGDHFYRQKVIILLEVSQNTRESEHPYLISKFCGIFNEHKWSWPWVLCSIHKKNFLTAMPVCFVRQLKLQGTDSEPKIKSVNAGKIMRTPTKITQFN